jgi:hypothetical protein
MLRGNKRKVKGTNFTKYLKQFPKLVQETGLNFAKNSERGVVSELEIKVSSGDLLEVKIPINDNLNYVLKQNENGYTHFAEEISTGRKSQSTKYEEKVAIQNVVIRINGRKIDAEQSKVKKKKQKEPAYESPYTNANICNVFQNTSFTVSNETGSENYKLDAPLYFISRENTFFYIGFDKKLGSEFLKELY